MPNFWWQIAKFDIDREVGYGSALNWRLGFANVRVLSHDDIFWSNCFCKSDRYVSYPLTPTMRFCHLVWDNVCGLLWTLVPVLWDNSFKLVVSSPNRSDLTQAYYYWASVWGCHNQWALLLLADFPPTAEHPMWKTTQWFWTSTCVVEILQPVGKPVV